MSDDNAQHPHDERPRHHRGLLIGGAAVIALAVAAAGVGVGVALGSMNSSSSASRSGATPGRSHHDRTFAGPGTTSVNATAATAAQKVGVVTIDSTLNFSEARAAGTGIILTSSGEILTNNHVVQGSTAITVTVVSTGARYTAKVVGTDETDDIAVLQLVNSSGASVTGLTRAVIDHDALSQGDTVTSVGNAEGTGTLVAATGTVTALQQSITVTDDVTGADEHLGNLIETDADVVSGDSGGPLIDRQGEVTGVVTAATSGTHDVAGYAIPIRTALGIARQIVDGRASSTIVIGLPGFLGVELADTQTGSGVLISGIVAGSPAAGTGLAAGDAITAVDGTVVTTSDSLSARIKARAVGSRVTITYTDAAGATQQATVTLAEGPAA
jgi:S1-C subfamily serine protease